MAYTYQIDTNAMFEDRTNQFISFGLSEADVTQVHRAITDMWSNRPGGWVYEWSRLAARYADKGNHFLASLAYGCAKFPCLADSAKRAAMASQTKEYVAAAPTFSVRFERRTLTMPYRGGMIDVPVHLFTTTDTYAKLPVLMLSGGVDTWKMDVHAMCIASAQHAGVTVLAFDMPGTGEMPVPLDPYGDEVILGLVREARSLGNGKVAHLGVSFGASFSAMTGLSGSVDAAIVLGGPIDASYAKENIAKLPYGMKDIVGNAMGFDHQPTFDELTTATVQLSRRKLLQCPSNSPMLFINGADDHFIPQADTLVFNGRPDTEVRLIPGADHCAFSKMAELMSIMIGWLHARL